MTVRINEDYFPLIIEDYEGQMTDDEAIWHRKYVADLLEQGERYGFLCDFRDSAPVSQEQRKIDAQFIKDNQDIIKELAIGVAFVVPSALLRIALNFLLFLSPLPMPYIAAKTVQEAGEWLEGRFKEEGIAIPEGAYEYIQNMECREQRGAA